MEIAVESFIKDVTTPAVSGAYTDINSIVEGFEIDGLEDQLIELSFTRDLYDPIDLTDKTVTLLNNYLSEVIQNHEIVISHDASLFDKIKFCQFLLLIQNWLDPTGIIRITESSGSAEEKTAELAFMTVGESIEKFMSIIESVSDAFIIKLESLYKTPQTDNNESFVTSQELIDNLKLITKYINITETVGYNLIKSGTPIGLKFSTYEKYIRKHLEYQDIDVVAKQLFVLLYMSEDGYANPFTVYQEQNDIMLHDIDRIAKVGIELKKLITGFTSFKKQQQLDKKVTLP